MTDPTKPKAQKPMIGGERLREFQKKTKGGFRGRQSPRGMAIQNRLKSLTS
jgi:hypothetical protein